jgi:methyl-accepting chemotaxis protein
MMSTKDEITKAISAHRMWKQKLRLAIITGECESTPERVKMDNNCSFGKWLHERIDPSVKTSSFYLKVVDLHAQFHKEAGKILEFALNGKKHEADELMGLGKDFSKLSDLLIQTMKEWQQSLD